jgi:hypothetical protein
LLLVLLCADWSYGFGIDLASTRPDLPRDKCARILFDSSFVILDYRLLFALSNQGQSASNVACSTWHLHQTPIVTVLHLVQHTLIALVVNIIAAKIPLHGPDSSTSQSWTSKV